MKTQLVQPSIWRIVCGWLLAGSMVLADEFQHDATGNLTNTQASLSSAPSLSPQQSELRLGMGESLNLAPPVQDAGFASYQWYLGTVAISGATNAALFIPAVTASGNGVYSLVVSNAQGVVTGQVASVTTRANYAGFGSTNGLLFFGGASVMPGSDGAAGSGARPGVLLTNLPPDYALAGLWLDQPQYCRNGFTTRFRIRGRSNLQFRFQPEPPSSPLTDSTPQMELDMTAWSWCRDLNCFDKEYYSRLSLFAPPETNQNRRITASYFINGASQSGINSALGGVWEDGNVHEFTLQHDGLRANLWMNGSRVLTDAIWPLEEFLAPAGVMWVGFVGGAAEIFDWSFDPNSRDIPLGEVGFGIYGSRVDILRSPSHGLATAGGEAWLHAQYLAGRGTRPASPFTGIQDDVLTYQWQFNGVDLPGETQATLHLTGIQAQHAGEYRVNVYGRRLENGFGGPHWVREFAASGTNRLAVQLPLNKPISTGLGDNRLPIAYGAPDPHWRLLPGSPDTNPPVVSYTGNGWAYSSTNSAWLVPVTRTSPGGISTYRYQTWFWLEPWEAQTAIIRGQWSASMKGADILINGLSTGQQTASPDFQVLAPFTITRGLVAGSNSLTFVVTNASSSDTGLRVEFAGSTVITNAGAMIDSDADGLPDAYELGTFDNLSQSSTNDFDGDGVSNGQELTEGTDPANAASFRPRLTVNITGANVLRSPSEPSYEPGTMVTLTALPTPGAVFLGWQGSLTGAEASVTFPITSNMVVEGVVAWPAPGFIEAEDFGYGGLGVDYYDTDSTNRGGSNYRTGGVDIGPVYGGGYKISYSELGEWMNYTIFVPSSELYRAVLRAASGNAGGVGRLDFSSGSVSNLITVLGTGDWQKWTNAMSGSFLLAAGLQTMRFTYVQPGFDLDSIEIVPVSTAPFRGQAWPVPGLVEVEHFDEGGEGASYHDADPGNNAGPGGLLLRTSDVDVFPTAAASGGYQVGWVGTGEWLNYTLDVASNGIYGIELRYSSGGSGGVVHFESLSGTVAIPQLNGTGSYETYRSATSAPVRLEAGSQIHRLYVETSGGLDLDSFHLVATTSAPPVVVITNPIPGQTLAAGFDVSLAASASDPDGSVVKLAWFADGLQLAEQTNAPYTLRWQPPTAGVFTLTAQATDNVGLVTTSAPVTVISSTNLLLGGLKAEYFTNIAGVTLANLTNHAKFLAGTPDVMEQATEFESRRNWADAYGVRLSGWVLPPLTGNYKFYLASDDQGALFLSTNASATGRRQIAMEPAWNGYREYVNGANQASRGDPPANISTNIWLEAGRAYYVEALLKEGTANDHLSVAVLPPGGGTAVNGAAPIPGRYLAFGTPYAGSFEPLSAACLTNSGQVGIGFDRILDQETATAITNYQLVGAIVSSAVLAPDRQGVLLNVSGLTGSNFTVHVRSVKDAFGNATPDTVTLIGPVLPQTRQDVGGSGDPAVAGVTFSSRAGDFDVQAGGSDIWNSTDGFHFVNELRTGDFDVKVRVASLQAIDRWSKAGLMVRESLTGGSRHLMALVAPAGPTLDGAAGGLGNNAYELNFRPVSGQASASWATNNNVANVPYPNAWIRLKRQGNVFSAFRSSDGSNWTQLGQTNQLYPSAVYVGLATTAHNNAVGYTTLARYRDYRAIFGSNLPPVSSGFVATTPQGQPLVIPFASLLTPVADPEGDLVSFVSADSVSAQNGTIIMNTSSLVYSPAVGFTGADQLSYRVSDPFGAQSTVLAWIAVLPAGVKVNTFSSPVVAGGVVSFTFTGLPGRTYQVWRAEKVQGPWANLGAMTIQPDGNGAFVDNSPLPVSGFYRTLLVPLP